MFSCIRLRTRQECCKRKIGGGSPVMSSNFCAHLIFKFGDLIEFFVLKDGFN